MGAIKFLNFLLFSFVYTYNGGVGHDVARDGIYDGGRFIYSAGYTLRIHNHGDTNYDWVIVKIDTSGNEKWKVFYDGGYGDDQSYGIGQRSDGKLVVVGYKDNNGNKDWRIAVYDTSNGNIIDSLIIGGPGSDYAYSVSIYHDTIFVCGRYTVTGEGWNWRVLKIDPDLTVVWDSVWHGGNGNDIPYKLMVKNKKIYVSGYYDSGDPYKNEMKIKVYKRNGEFIRAGEWGDEIERNDDAANSLCIDDTGNIYIAGYSALSSGTRRWKIIKFDSTLQNIKWEKVKSPGSSVRSEEARGIKIKDNYLYVCGYIYNSSTGFDWRIIRYSLTGTDSIIKEIDFNGYNDYAHAICFYKDKVVVFGSLSNSFDQDFVITDFTQDLTGYMEFFVKMDVKNEGEFYIVELEGKGEFDSIKVFLDGELLDRVYRLPYRVRVKGYEVFAYVFKGREKYKIGPYYMKKISPAFIASEKGIFYFNPLDISLTLLVFDISGRKVLDFKISPGTRGKISFTKNGIFILKTDSITLKFFNIRY